ncbi:Fungal-trans domain-containing protein [Mycena kentingensis (nom. inval.)]|nr:Fungal-trans domain-containing protein [Mycena kentingensis (nom. inval.)]
MSTLQSDEKRRYSIDLAVQLEHALENDSESLPPTPGFLPPRHHKQPSSQLPALNIDPEVLAHIIGQLRHQLADMTRERDDLITLLISPIKAMSLDEALSEARRKHKDDEEAISLLRTKVEESRRGLMRLQTESRRQTAQPGTLDVARANAPSAFSLTPASSKRASFTPLTGTFAANQFGPRPNGHRRISSVSDSHLDSSAAPLALAAPPAVTNRRLSGFFGRSSPPQPPHATLSPSPSPDELEKLRKVNKTLQDALEETRHDLAEANEAREAAESCTAALRDFIAENNLGTEVKLPPLPASTTGAEPDTVQKKPWGGFGKLFKVDTTVNRSGGPPSASTATASPVIPPAAAPAGLQRKLTGFFSSRASISSIPSLAPVQTGQQHRDSMYSASDASSLAEPISPTANEPVDAKVRVRDATGGSPDILGESAEGVRKEQGESGLRLVDDSGSLRPRPPKSDARAPLGYRVQSVVGAEPFSLDLSTNSENFSLKLRCDRAMLSMQQLRQARMRRYMPRRFLNHWSRYAVASLPNRVQTGPQGNRFVLASTQELHQHISELANRVRELEDALRTSHSHISGDTHPLLSEDLLRLKAPLQRELPALRNHISSSNPKDDEHNPDVVDAFGSLSISLSGGAKYFGTTANSWYFLQNETAEENESEDNHLKSLQNVLPAHILTRAAAFPISPVVPPAQDGDPLRTLFWYLPPGPKAASLRDIYFMHASWMYAPISPESFNAEVYSQFYDPNAGPPTDQPLLAHRLALMFIVLAIGQLMDTNESAYNVEAEKYHQLARAALFLHSFFDHPTINAVQCLFLMTFYLFLSERHGGSSGVRWNLFGIAVKVAQSIGLHRDSGRFKVDSLETQRRRELFWELYVYDSWGAWTLGRPTSFTLAHVDCKLPHSNEPPDDQAYHNWKHRFVSECMVHLHEQAFGARTPTYATVLQLDRKMRAFPVPQILQVAGFGSAEPRSGGFSDSVMLTLQRHVVLAIREMNLLYLHRSFFARAISEHKDPLASPYGTSVIAAYRSAGSLVALMRNLHSQVTDLSQRIWFLWTHMFSCAIILGSIVTRCPSMSLAPSALVQLDSACELFSKAARGFRAGKVLNIMLHLQEKAHNSLEDFRKGKIAPSTLRISPETPLPAEENDELSTLGGKTRLVAKKEPMSPLMLDRSPTSHNPVVPLPLSPSLNEQVHPSVVEYLNTFQHAGGAINSYSDVDVDLSPVSMYGMSSMSYHSDATGSFMAGSPTHGDSQQQHAIFPPAGRSSNAGHGAPNGNAITFPQYFPVYDYRTATMSDAYASNAPMLDMNPMPGQRRTSGSPEGNMQSNIWNDFVGEVLN